MGEIPMWQFHYDYQLHIKSWYSTAKWLIAPSGLRVMSCQQEKRESSGLEYCFQSEVDLVCPCLGEDGHEPES